MIYDFQEEKKMPKLQQKVYTKNLQAHILLP